MELVAEHPDHESGQVQLGTCLMLLNKTALAVETFDLVLLKNPNNPIVLQNYGEDCCNCGD